MVEQSEMRDQVTKLIARMQSAERPELLALLATAISEFTILGRASYDNEDEARRLRVSNEEIHRIAGHVRDLSNPDEAFTESRAGAIGEALRLLHPSALVRISARS